MQSACLINEQVHSHLEINMEKFKPLQIDCQNITLYNSKVSKAYMNKVLAV